MRHLLTFISLLFAVSVQAATSSRIAIEITVTNVPVTGNTIALNGSVRTWTNAHSSSTLLTNLVGLGPSATNLFNGYAIYPIGSGITHAMTASNKVKFTAPLGATFTGSATGDWATVTITTQSGPTTFTALWPLENMVGETNRTNQGSSLVYGLGIYSTNAFPTNSSAISNALQKGAGVRQDVISPVRFLQHEMSVMATNSQIIFTNAGFWSYLTTDTNGFPALRYSDTTPLDPADALGFVNQDHILTLKGAAQVLPLLRTNELPGFGFSRNTWRVANTWTNYDQVFERGFFSSNSVVYWQRSTNGLTEGSTNGNIRVTGTNSWGGDLAFDRYSNNTIVDGNNAGILIGTNVVVELSGGSTIAQYAGFTASRDGDVRFVRMTGPITNIIVNQVDASWSTDGTAARRIVTGTGASLALTNQPSWLKMMYRGASSRWEVMDHSR